VAGKREKKKNIQHLPGALLVLLVLAILMPAGGPRGVAADSPAESQEPETLQQMEELTPVAEPDPVAIVEPVWEGPVPESALVEDTYFDDAVFLGDSRTDGLRLYGGMTRGTFLYATGATVESVFTKAVETPLGEMPLLDALAQMECSKIYVMLGVNELGWKGTDIFRNQSTELIRRLQEDHPDAEIVIQSILPVSAKIDDEGRYVNNGRINEYNQIWLELAEEFHVNYMNVAEVLPDENGQLPAELTYDGVHLNKAGCRQWLDYLRTHAVGDFQDVIAPAVVETEAPSEPVLSAAEN
jgi:hypothetical protein